MADISPHGEFFILPKEHHKKIVYVKISAVQRNKVITQDNNCCA